MSQILAGVEHVVVVMLENRSLDNMLGSMYANGAQPSLVLPAGSPVDFDGLKAGFANPTNSGSFSGEPPVSVPVALTVSSPTVPDPDPAETFANVSYQLFGPQSPSPQPRWPMQGFLVNYQTTGTTQPNQIMQCHGSTQVPVLAALARNYAVSDAWFASVPSQTWPNRAFVHAGTSNGRVDNGDVPDPLAWNVRTIFNVLTDIAVSWTVYHDTVLVPPLTRMMFPQLVPPGFDGNFRGFDDFVADCANDRLPQYSFIEPSFLLEPNDQHPPHDINAGEAFLHAIWTAVSTSAAFAKTLLVITYDEHGGCYDHVLPPFGATPPDESSSPGDQGFGFDRFGVRVPTVLVSPRIAPGTVFRSGTGTPFDHTSILATLRDWLPIGKADMLGSARIAAAPTLDPVLTLGTPRTDVPTLASPPTQFISTPTSVPANSLQRSLVSATARHDGQDPRAALAQIRTRQHAIDYFRERGSKL